MVTPAQELGNQQHRGLVGDKRDTTQYLLCNKQTGLEFPDLDIFGQNIHPSLEVHGIFGYILRISKNIWYLVTPAVTNLVPKHIWSPDIWSPTIGPKFIGLSPSGQTVPNQFCPHEQMVPKNSVAMDKWSPTNLVPPGQMVHRIFCLSRGTGYDDLEIWGPNWLETICPGGPNLLGPFVQEDQI